MAPAAPPAAAYQVELTTDYARGILSALSSIKAKGKQTCAIAINNSGVAVMTEDDGKCIQGEVFFRCQVFKQFDLHTARGTTHLSLDLGSLVDTVGVFASVADGGGDLHLSWPGQDGQLVLQLSEPRTQVTSYAELSCIEADPPDKWSDQWEDPAASFVLEGALLKEAVDDLEWAGGEVALEMSLRPSQVVLSAAGGAGQLKVTVPEAVLQGSLKMPSRPAGGGGAGGGGGAFRYKHKHLKAAMCHIPTAAHSNVRTKVSVDANGLLHVIHMLNLAAGARPGAATTQGGQVLYGAEALSAVSQGAAGAASGVDRGGGSEGRIATVVFYIMPVERDDEGDDDA